MDLWLDSDVSIHAPVKGATLERQCSGQRVLRFNPRAREGRDQSDPFLLFHWKSVSIHAPVKGAT